MVNKKKYKRYIIKNIYNLTGGWSNNKVYYCPSQLRNNHDKKSIIEIISDLANPNISLEKIQSKLTEYSKIPDSSNKDYIQVGSKYEEKKFNFLLIEELLPDELVNYIDNLKKILKDEKLNYKVIISKFNYVISYLKKKNYINDIEKSKLDNLTSDEKKKHYILCTIIKFLENYKKINKKTELLLYIIWLSRMLNDIRAETIKNYLNYEFSLKKLINEPNLKLNEINDDDKKKLIDLYN